MNKRRIITENITYGEPLTHQSSWQNQLRDALSNPMQLAQNLELDPSSINVDASPSFPLVVPLQFVDKMQKGNPNDPLLLQVLPQLQENIQAAGFTNDPLEETDINTPKGLLQKYHGRVLIILAGKCAINCRYCFRRHYPYVDARISAQEWQDILGYIQADSSINEVIFSGGEPLLVSDNKLARYIADLEKVTHLSTLRIHTRLPIVIPERLTPQLQKTLEVSRLNTVIVLHSNHPNEIDENLAQHVQVFKKADITFLNQSVLLTNINDNSQTLAILSKKLFAIGVLPYYLHTLDEVNGAYHFNVPLVDAKTIHYELKSMLSGYLVPKLVTETPNEKSKVTIS